jgi:acid stress-induced BolA-like protein IbaG/YrbA
MHYFWVPKMRSIHSLHWNQNDVRDCLEHFANLSNVKRCKPCVSGLNALFQSTEVVNHPFYSIGTKMMFGSVLVHFANLQHVKRGKTCVSSLNALFQGTQVVKHPFYSIRPKMIFGSVSEHFANLRHVKRGKTCVSSLNALFRVPKLRIIHSIQLEEKLCWE